MSLTSLNLNEEENTNLRGLISELEDQRAKNPLPPRNSPLYAKAVRARLTRVTMKGVLMLGLEKLLKQDKDLTLKELLGETPVEAPTAQVKDLNTLTDEDQALIAQAVKLVSRSDNPERAFRWGPLAKNKHLIPHALKLLASKKDSEASQDSDSSQD